VVKKYDYLEVAKIVDQKKKERKAKAQGKEYKPRKVSGIKVQDKVNNARAENFNHVEDTMVKLLDHKSILFKHAKWLEKLEKGRIDVGGFMGKVSPTLVVELLKIATGGDSEKVRLEAIKDFLDRAGYSKVNKVAIAGSIDSSATKEELINTILGLSGKADIEIVDDETEAEDTSFQEDSE
jgi:hypothetical protein